MTILPIKKLREMPLKLQTKYTSGLTRPELLQLVDRLLTYMDRHEEAEGDIYTGV